MAITNCIFLTSFFFSLPLSRNSLFETSSEGTACSQSDSDMESMSSSTTDSCSNINIHINNEINNIRKEVDNFPRPAYIQTTEQKTIKDEEMFFENFQLDLCLEEDTNIL